MKTKILSLFILSLFIGNVSAQVVPFENEVTMGIGPDVKSMTYEEIISTTSGSFSPEFVERFRDGFEKQVHIGVVPVIRKSDESQSIPEPLFKILNDSLEDHKPIFQNLD
ncbi:hypothetical protein [Stenotrophomonas maltophilia]|uniref:hypothetical protein n=1 Tax=Stenotrophomonas maltophilia TaxID=40324 RepID=UPI0012FD543F|nr:hypothetical protein [Stenotrophomonas maltophilia]